MPAQVGSAGQGPSGVQPSNGLNISPTTLFLMGMGADAAGSFMQAQGIASQQTASANAMRHNARLLEEASVRHEAETAEDERRLRVIARKHIGSMRAARGASGVALDGSALDVISESAATAELDALTLRYQGAMRSYTMRQQASGLRKAAKDADKAAKKSKNAGIGGFIGGAAGAVLGMSAGPMGAAAGYQIGSQVGSTIGGSI